MQAVKLHLLFTVVATQLTALFVDRAVPYFPIEVSRTAAAGPWSQRVFTAGVLSLGGTLLVTGGGANASTLAIWLSLVVIALFDDVYHWTLHMLGVAGLGATVATLLVGSRHWQHDTCVLGLAAVLYLARLAMKALAVWHFEPHDPRWSPDASPDALLYPLQHCFRLSQDIMYHGGGGGHAEATLLVFRLCGVLQWVVFWLFSELLH
jgi:hypothetical protein